MSPRWFPLLVGLLPIVAIHLGLLIAINAGSVAPCFPYLDGCTSISATGRYEPAVFLFKPAMTIEAVLMMAYWFGNAAWLRSLAALQAPVLPVRVNTMLVLGFIGSLALVIYVTFLGTQAPFYEFMRRFGIYFYFLCTVVAQILLARQSLRLGRQLNLPSVVGVSRVQLGLATTPIVLGTLNLVLKAVLEDADSVENTIEWYSALIMHVFFLMTCATWRDTGFDADWRCRKPAR